MLFSPRRLEMSSAVVAALMNAPTTTVKQQQQATTDRQRVTHILEMIVYQLRVGHVIPTASKGNYLLFSKEKKKTARPFLFSRLDDGRMLCNLLAIDEER